ncbi:MAG: uncharacterized protein JWO56_1305 [Acidobacteria bacterium]|nr:uncharacterized protein [Acidobacteriota bacterium]
MTRTGTICALLLLLSAATPAFPLELAREQAVSIPARRPTGGLEMPQAPLATNGTTFFSAWVATRNGENAVYGTRLAADGRVLDPSGLRLASTDASYGTVAVVWTGRDYLVFAPESQGIVVARVRNEGRVIAAPEHIYEPGVFLVGAAVTNGAHYVLLVREKTAAGLVVGKILVVSPDLSVERSFPLNDATTASAGASLVSDGSGFLLVYENYSATSDIVYAQQLDAGGRPAGERRVVPTDHPTSVPYLGRFWPAVAPNGSGYTIVWMSGGISGLTLSSSGAFGNVFRIAEEEASFPSIGWNGRENLVTWTHTAFAPDGAFHLDGARITAAGEILPARTLSTTGLGQAQAALAGIPAGFVGLWFGNVFGDGAHDSLASRFYDQDGPLLAAGTTNVLTAWGEAGAIYAGRLAFDGTPLDGAGIRLTSTQAGEQAAPLAVASNGRTYLVAWRRSDGQIAVSRIAADGTLLDPFGGALVTSLPGNLVAASDGVDFLLVWSFGGTLVSHRIPAEGAIPVAPAPPPTARFPETPLALTWNGATYSLLWQQELEGERSVQQRLSPLDRNGRVLGTAIIGLNLAVAGMEPAGNELLVAYAADQKTYTQRFSRTADPTSERLPVLDRAVQATLARTRDGFALVYPNGSAIDGLLLDANGAPRGAPSTILRKTAAVVSDATFANGTTWLLYTAPQFVTDAKQNLRRAFTGELREGPSATAEGGRRRATVP